MLRVARNYPGHGRSASTGWRCQACSMEAREDEEHLASCQGYTNIQASKDLRNEGELIEFYKSVMARRKERGRD